MSHDPWADKIIRDVKTKRSVFWEKERESRALTLFHRASQSVPAYKDFLKKNKVNPSKIRSFKDFESVPPMSKKNYLRQYPMEALLWNGQLQKTLVWTSTSGSTGEPFYFPRSETLDRQYSILAEQFIRANNKVKGPTLVIVGFGMGVWIGGLITYKAFEIAGKRLNQSISIITPGINKQEIFHALEKLAPHFEQTILIGYPPFIKDVLEEATGRNIDLKKIYLRLLFAAEAFTESFRDHVAELAGIKNVYRDTLNIYGTADLGAMAFETPVSIFMRRKTLENEGLFKRTFSDIGKTPTVAQYDPFFITFESMNNEILLTGDNTIPLIRYAIGDHGGVFSMTEARNNFKAHRMNLDKEAKKEGASVTDFPFVYVYERSDLSTKLYGAIIYPEHIKEGLGVPALRNFVTGRFTMMTNFNKNHDEYLEVNVEVKPKVKPTAALQRMLQKYIVESLLKRNAEYRNNHSSMAQKVIPNIVLWVYEDPLYFKSGIKQKWVVKK